MNKTLKLFLTCIWMIVMTTPSRAELIVLASPIKNDPYYQAAEEGIFQFHLNYAREIIKYGDDVLILTHAGRYDDYVAALGVNHVLLAPMEDIWMRDFAPSNAIAPIMFRYSAAGQGGSQADADYVQEKLAITLDNMGIQFEESDLLNDGGNFVDDYAGNVVVSTKFLSDNKLSEAEARALLTKIPSISHVAFIEADEQGGLEHADGIVSFIDSNVLMVNSTPQDADYTKKLHADLRRGLPGVTIHDMPTPYDDSVIHDSRFGSACGLYTNALVTSRHIYFPQFGIKQDAIALQRIRAITKKTVIPVPSQQVCTMGGGVRCMSWQIRDQNMIKSIKKHLPKPQ